MAVALNSEVRFLRGVGEQRMKKYQRLGVTTVEDLLRHLPRDYIDLRGAVSIGEAVPGEKQVVRAILGEKEPERQLRRGYTIQKLRGVDEADTITLTFFNGKYTVAPLEVGREYLFYGRVEGTLTRKEMPGPMVFPGEAGGLSPIYPLTSGLTSRGIAKDAATALAALEEIPDPQPSG